MGGGLGGKRYVEILRLFCAVGIIPTHIDHQSLNSMVCSFCRANAINHCGPVRKLTTQLLSTYNAINQLFHLRKKSG